MKSLVLYPHVCFPDKDVIQLCVSSKLCGLREEDLREENL